MGEAKCQPAGQPNLEEMAARATQGGPGPPSVFPHLAGRLVGPSHIWLPPSIWGVYYWYWYIIGYIFPIMGNMFLIMGGIFPNDRPDLRQIKEWKHVFVERGRVILFEKTKKKGPCQGCLTPSTEFGKNTNKTDFPKRPFLIPSTPGIWSHMPPDTSCIPHLINSQISPKIIFY